MRPPGGASVVELYRQVSRLGIACAIPHGDLSARVSGGQRALRPREATPCVASRAPYSEDPRPTCSDHPAASRPRRRTGHTT
ncbi:uncharacterized protein SOCE836_095840 [Sorangium cellulosum]|uniref:Uncharacterized protein n=1 Tax=Sorangium cellulosum TaxID=56 RepID=A0A4P2R430_SORCE|nr:uncharacterized protein SOCE836_095840 [Sorangium cellulosum]